MSYQIKIDPRASKAGRFISAVHREIQKAFSKSGLKQNDLAKMLDIDRSTINRQLLGQSNLTLRSISDLAWAMDCRLNFSLTPLSDELGVNARTAQITETSGYVYREISTQCVSKTTTTIDHTSFGVIDA